MIWSVYKCCCLVAGAVTTGCLWYYLPPTRSVALTYDNGLVRMESLTGDSNT